MSPFDRELFDQIPVPVAVAHDRDATRITVNRRFAALLGIQPDANAALSAPDAQQSPACRVFRNGRPVVPSELPFQVAARTNEAVTEWEADVVRSDGTRITVVGDAVPLRDAHGTVLGSVGVFFDVSDRKRAERERRSAETRLRHVIDSMSDAFSAVDRDWRLTYVNERYLQMAGKRREDLIGRNVWDVFPEAMRTRVYEEARRAMAEGSPRIVEDYYPPLDVWFETRMYPTEEGLASFTTDITERKRIERQREALLTREQAALSEVETATRLKDQFLTAAVHLATIVESSEDAIVSKDLQGKITSWNQGAERIFGYAAAEAVGQSIRLIVPADRQAEVDEVLRRVGGGEVLNHFDTVRVRKDGANRLKDEFLATLSHELRTPLNAILGYARMLRSGLVDEQKQSRAIEILERNATSLTQIVGDVLDVSRIVSGKIRLNVQPVDLSVVVSDAVATVLPAADAKGVRVQTVMDPSASPVSGDPDRLQQVVWNLVLNAVKFTPRGGRVQVRVESVNSAIDIVVSDTGIGIRSGFLPHIFERFRQADSGPTREHGGLGLGLAIARHIVEMHGGTIHAGSEGEGRGATFRVGLPVMILRPEAGISDRRVHSRSDRGGAAGSLPDLQGLRVLAVDDDHDSLRLVREVLEFAGAEVTTTDSGDEALEALATTRPDVLLADVGMPGMDGFELMAQIRRSADRTLRRIPAAAVTAYARAEDRAKVLRSGFHMHLGKPVDPGELLAAVAALAKRTSN